MNPLDQFFFKIRRGGGSLKSVPLRQKNGFKTVAYSPKNCQNWWVWYKFVPKEYITLSDFLAKFCIGRESRVRKLTPTFTIVPQKVGL